MGILGQELGFEIGSGPGSFFGNMYRFKYKWEGELVVVPWHMTKHVSKS